MAALTRAEQGNCPASAPNSPRHRSYGKGWMDRKTSAHSSSHNGQTGLDQTTSACNPCAGSRIGTVPQGKGNTWGPIDGWGSVQIMKDPNLLQCFRCQGWGHMARDCATPAKTLNRDGGTKGMQPNPLPAAISNKFTSFPPCPQTKTDQNKGR